MCWTEKYRKAFVLSYDDGVRQDIRLVEMLNKPLEEIFDMSTPWKRAFVEDILKNAEK